MAALTPLEHRTARDGALGAQGNPEIQAAASVVDEAILHDSRVLVFAPTGRDAALTCEILREAGFNCKSTNRIEELCMDLDTGAGAAILAEEALDSAALQCLFDALARQPAWSDLPLIVFAQRDDTATVVLETLGLMVNVSILERPVRIATLVSAVRTALRARRRQWEIRDLLQGVEDASRRKDEFLAMLGHELRNPLAAISNAVEVMSRRPADMGRCREIIDRQAHNLARIIDDLLDVSRVTLSKVTLHPRLVDLREIAVRSVESVRPAAEEHHHTLDLAMDSDPIIVEGDPVRLEQVLSNLLSNAIKYTPPGGHIHISVRSDQREAVVVVRDTGVGITAEMLPQVFDLFTQAEASLDRAQGGLGLGLKLVQGLVRLHGGKVIAHSDGPGQGSEFTVRLPLAVEASAVDDKPESMERKSSPAAVRRVVIVDDNRDGRESLRELIELWGHQVTVAADGPAGLKTVLSDHPEVCLIDIGLPGMSGYEVARRIREESNEHSVFLIAITGYGRPEDRQAAMDAGFDAYLIKPVDLGELSKLLDSLSIAHDSAPAP